jgi:hypothetical protein
MLFLKRQILLQLVIIMAFCLGATAQDTIHNSRKICDSILNKTIFSKQSTLVPDSIPDIRNVIRQRLASVLRLPDTSGIRSKINAIIKPSFPLFSRPWLKIQGGYVSYQGNYRSGIDTPFNEKNLWQHVIAGSANITIGSFLPIRVNYFERQTNSSYFRDYRDISIDLNTAQFRQLQSTRLQKILNEHMAAIAEPRWQEWANIEYKHYLDAEKLLNSADLITRLIEAKETILEKQITNASSDSIKLLVDATQFKEAKEFISAYEKRKEELSQLRKQADSLQQLYNQGRQKIERLKQIFSPGELAKNSPRHALQELEKLDIKDKRLQMAMSLMAGLRKFSVGRSNADISALTVKNVNINGLNLAYEGRWTYIAATAGTVDFRVRDLIRSNQPRSSQFVYALQLGLGLKNGSHIAVTGYRGKRQLSSLLPSQSVIAYGLGVEMQYRISSNHILTGEIAQSFTTQPISGNPYPNNKSVFNWSDRSNKAYFGKIVSYFPATATRIEGSYRFTGANFQSFLNYRPNSNAVSWQGKWNQYAFRNMLQLNISARKNDFWNPYFPQRFDANTIFKTVSATFRKRNWPIVSVSYTPTSQYSVIDSVVYENYFQSLNLNANHNYKIGNGKFNSSLTYSKLFNSGSDSGFIYFNSTSYQFRQHIDFAFFSSYIGFSQMKNGFNDWNIMEGGYTFKISKEWSLRGGMKIHLLNNVDTRIGYYFSGRLPLKKNGDLNWWVEKNYFPGLNKTLVNTNLMTINYTRYF